PRRGREYLAGWQITGAHDAAVRSRLHRVGVPCRRPRRSLLRPGREDRRRRGPPRRPRRDCQERGRLRRRRRSARPPPLGNSPPGGVRPAPPSGNPRPRGPPGTPPPPLPPNPPPPAQPPPAPAAAAPRVVSAGDNHPPGAAGPAFWEVNPDGPVSRVAPPPAD